VRVVCEGDQAVDAVCEGGGLRLGDVRKVLAHNALNGVKRKVDNHGLLVTWERHRDASIHTHTCVLQVMQKPVTPKHIPDQVQDVGSAGGRSGTLRSDPSVERDKDVRLYNIYIHIYIIAWHGTKLGQHVAVVCVV
jgi:hypothetical protein